MRMYFLPIPTRCGGTGDGTGVFPVRDGDLESTAPAGVSDGEALGILRGTPHIGMEVIGEDTGDPDIGDRDGITIITIRTMDGPDRLIITTIAGKEYVCPVIPAAWQIVRLIVTGSTIADVPADVWFPEAATETLLCWATECV